MKIISLFIGADILLLGVACYCFESLYYGSYEHAVCVSERRLPLWYPYEICEMCKPVGQAELHDWRDYSTSDVEWEGQLSEPIEEDYARALSAVQEIVDFNVGSNVVCGLRKLKRFNPAGYPQGESFGERYFLFATNMTAAQYFSRESDYLAECKRFGIDGRDLNDFDTNHRAFVRKEAQTTFRGRIEFALGHGKAGGRWLKLWIGILLGANIVGIFLCNLGAKYNAVRLDKWK